MDSLYFIGKAQFHQLATHISLYHEDMSSAHRQLSSETLREVGLKPERFTYWNVPMMTGYLGKAIPLDIHGGYVVTDEEKAMPMAGSYGMLRYAYLTAATRAKEGGRWRYDFMTMNGSLMAGAAAGFVWLSFGRRRIAWMRRHPIGSIAASMMVSVVSTVMVRQGFKMLGVGIVQAQNSHKKALKKLHCIDCLEDVNAYTANQIEELRQQKIPTQPGMPPPPEEFVKRFEKNVALQCNLLSTDMDEVRIIRKWAGPVLCSVHKGLREDPAGFREPSGLVLLASDREKATQRPPLESTETPLEKHRREKAEGKAE